MADQKKAYLCGLGAVLMWSTVASAFKLSLQYMDHVQLLLFSSVTSILALALILLVQGRLGLALACSARQYRLSLLLGLLNPFLYYLVLLKAYTLLPAQEAQPLNYTWALTLVLLSIPLLKQKIGPKEILAMLVSYSGVWVISTRGEVFSLSFSDPLGVFLALASTIIWSLYWIFNTRDDRDPVVGLLLNFVFGLPFVLGYCLLFSELRLPAWPGLLGAAYTGLFEMGITYVLWLAALKLSENTAKVGNLIFLSPFLSLVFIHFLVGEEILPSTYAGLVLIVGGLLIRQIRTSSPAKSADPG